MLAPAADPDLDRVKTQTIERLTTTVAALDPRIADQTQAGARQWLEQLSEDGHWPDIDYADQTRGGWAPSIHLRRTLEMAQAYRAAGEPEKDNPAMRAAILRAVDYWLANDFQCPNWWQNEIGVPQDLSAILLLMEDSLTPERREKADVILSRAKIGMTGQNRVWLAGNVLMRGLLNQDPQLVQAARNAINEEIVITPEEGLQVDQSFHQHGPMLQLGNYGLSFARSAVDWLRSLRGTRYALDPDKVAIVRDYVLGGEAAVVWRGQMDISSCGRQLFPSGPAAKARSVEQLLAILKESDPAHAERYEAALQAILGESANPALNGIRHFWRSDYLVDRRANYFATLKMSSSRTLGSETVNDENLRGNLLGDGALFVYQSGREFENLFPVWDWTRLPGVTARINAPLRCNSIRNTRSFVGGVTDGQNAVAVLDYDRNGVRAHKSWFFFDGVIVALGSGIQSATDDEVRTSIAQCRLQTPVIVATPAGEETLADPQKRAGIRWAWQDGVGYYFPTPAEVMLEGKPQSGSWKKVYRAGPAEKLSEPVFSLWIEHGSQPADAQYAYLLLPGASEAQTRAFAENPRMEILQNRPGLQAVRKGDLAAAVFYQAGEWEAFPGVTLKFDQPGVVLLRQTETHWQLRVADPTQALDSISLRISGREETVRLPRGPEAGKSVALELPR